MNVSERELAEIIRESMVVAFEQVAKALAKAPEGITAQEAGADLLATRDQLIGQLTAAFDEKLKEMVA